ncbi:PLP-dependent aminotransferase family protein [Actinokineospora sp. NBRC 105648]|uniref:aminotransferase-like domain-containing protein n=1 Tax=Actinokineospora sp. NBRC 105648 TaxID=3032206 RepID=UPI0024A50C51|nr:PLP-dependent aminotransferase family protein [Actinokineospora sp. NBRC 105648]GLZ36660.1 aminotransferase class I/II [Actinokineospora sp. NBRC 105648]
MSAEDSAGPLSHRRSWSPGVVQQVGPAGTVDLGPGYLEPGLLPVDLLAAAYPAALAEYGSAALAYGDDRGAVPFRALVADRVARAEGPPCGPDNVLVTAGTSHALHLLATGLAQSGEVVLVEQYGYDYGRRILADRGLRARAVPMDAAGVDPAALDEAIATTRAAGERIAFAYLAPTFHNPTGLVSPVGRRRELLAVAARHGVLLVEDDAYAELGLDGGADPVSLAGLAGYRGVVRLRTFSKTLGPGLRLGYLLADPAIVGRLAGTGLFTSGGSANHVTSLAVAWLLRSGEYDRHLGWLRSRLRERRDALAVALGSGLEGVVEFTTPAGGYFLWLRSTHDEARLVTAAAAAKINALPGSRFGTGPQPTVRLAYSLNPPSALTAAAEALGRCWRALSSLERTHP